MKVFSRELFLSFFGRVVKRKNSRWWRCKGDSKNSFFTSYFQKLRFFKKLFYVLFERFGKYPKMAAQSKMADFWLFIIKKLHKINENIFFHSVNYFVLENIHILWEK
jgi:hypothetical protein